MEERGEGFRVDFSASVSPPAFLYQSIAWNTVTTKGGKGERVEFGLAFFKGVEES